MFNSENGYDLYAEFYDKKFKFLDSFEKDELMRMVGDINGKKVLDVGCGTGRLERKLIDAGAEIIGIDVSSEMIKAAKKKFPKVEFVKGDIENLPFEDEAFDLVVCSFVVVHLKNLDKAFEEIYRVLKPGGTFVLTNINQRKAPKLDIKGRGEIVIKSFYHIPEKVTEALEKALFRIEEEKFVYENGIWINQILKAGK